MRFEIDLSAEPGGDMCLFNWDTAKTLVDRLQELGCNAKAEHLERFENDEE